LATLGAGDGNSAYDSVAQGPTQGSKYAALDALRKLDPGKVTEALLRATKSRNNAVKEWALGELGKLPRPKGKS
jgi:hypothetical protein